MQVSVIIPCRNGADTIGRQLAALVQQQVDFDWEVIVVDNGSTDDSVAKAERYRDLVPHLRIVDASERAGVSYARNVGAEFAEGEWLVWCDADDVVGGTWLREMAAGLERYAAVASRFEGNWLNASRPNRPLGQQRRLETLWYPPFLKHAGGSGLGVWKEVHDRIGGFDESLARLEDTDYSIRLQLKGYGIHFAPKAVLHVGYRGSRQGLFRQAREWARANTRLYRRYGRGSRGTTAAWRGYARGLVNLVSCLRRLRSSRVRSTLVWQSGWHLGLLEGAILNRVAPVSERH